MGKEQTLFECQDCGALSPSWQGRCNSCQAWNSIIEIKTEKKSGKSPRKTISKAQALNKITIESQAYLPSSISELDQVLGQGFAKGSVTLLGGEPGIGKSTLSLQTALLMSNNNLKVLYVTAEESEQHILLRAKRLGRISETLFVLSDTSMTNIMAELESIKPDMVILDSIQTVSHSELSAVSGSVSQVKYCAECFIHWIKENHKVGLLIGHVTKDGFLAGPKVLEHMVDVILYFEGERNQQYRLLRCYKNRFFQTDEIGVFEMEEKGLVAVSQPSAMFINQFNVANSGSVISAIVEGSRSFLVEVQSLVVETGYGMAKRSFVGVNSNRANIVLATLEKILCKKMFSKDLFLNIIGGIKIDEPAMDLAILVAIVTSMEDVTLNRRIAFIGEIGLSGEIRGVPLIAKRLNEIEKMGFQACFLPKANMKAKPSGLSLDCIPVEHVRDVMAHLVKEFRHEHVVST